MTGEEAAQDIFLGGPHAFLPAWRHVVMTRQMQATVHNVPDKLLPCRNAELPRVPARDSRADSHLKQSHASGRRAVVEAQHVCGVIVAQRSPVQIAHGFGR